MEITNTNQLAEAIAILQARSAEEKEEMNEAFHLFVEGLKPVNLVKSLFSKDITANSVTNNVIDASIGLGAGILSKKIIIGNTGNIFKKVLGNIIELSVANIVSKNAGRIKSKGAELLLQLTKSFRNN